MRVCVNLALNPQMSELTLVQGQPFCECLHKMNIQSFQDDYRVPEAQHGSPADCGSGSGAIIRPWLPPACVP
jgi:hypothetical protein